jgi:tetratricopeptide (TPR) repeat protein
MALDREKTFAAAERLLKQGKAREALDECRRLAEDAPKDLLMLNRVGDLLARSGRGIDAIAYYDKIAEQFSASGFYPKAIAIIKKILKVDPQRTEALVRLGELNLKQKLPGEARAWLLQAADVYLKTREFAKAREVYEKLVQSEPDNFVHAVRLAEARAAEGDSARAGRDLIALGARMAAAGRHDDADRTFKRAIDLVPGRAEAVVGLARVHAAAGRRDEALQLADRAWSELEGAETVAGDLFLLVEHLGDEARSAALLDDARSDGVDDDSIEQACRAAFTQGKSESFWARARVLVDRWARSRRFDRAAQLLDRLSRIEEGGHLPALERLVELRKAEGAKPTAARAIERLVRAYQGKGRAGDVPALLETLKLFDPNSPLILVGRPAGAAVPAAPAAAVARSAAAAAPGAPTAKEAALTAALEAPAVPLSPADEEFVSGHLTEAEVFEKYGLHAESLSQLKAVTEKFPGHVVACERFVAHLRTGGDRGALRGGLLTLAFAKRAAGDLEGARRAASEASQIGGIEPAVHGALERLGLAAPPPPAPVPTRAPAPAPPPASKPPARPAAVTQAEEEELEILFDDAEEAPAPAAADPAAEIREEIEFYIGQGMIQDALARIAGARAQGAASPLLDALEAQARGAGGTDEGGISEDKLDEEDLSSIAAALEAEFPGDRAPAQVPAGEPESEQSVDEVFAAFKEHVREQIDGGDYRTHYDLGIAYKEMGLGDDAIAEFRIATGAPELYREACSMIGLCFWQRGDGGEAIRWYRAALDAPADESEPLSGLRYDLAEILLATGDERGALDLFSQVLELEPAYRDVKDRTEELRARLSR